MALCSLEVHNVRNISFAHLHLSSQFNIFTGENGAGKTSLLEAVYLLAQGRTFRGSEPLHVVRRGESSCLIAAKLRTGSTLRVEYQRSGFAVRLDGQPLTSRAELAALLPVLFLGPDTYRLLSEGPDQRRKLMDWGLFHVEPRFLSTWRKYQRTLKQRNAALRRGHPVETWDSTLVEAAEQLDSHRRRYIDELLHYVHQTLDLLNIGALTYEYSPGWRRDHPLADVLKAGLTHDKECGYTRYGPHRADLQIKLDAKHAKDVISRGQQKLLVSGLLLAQASHMHSATNKRCTLLIDDLGSELDVAHRNKLLRLLESMGMQVLFTVLEPWDWVINSQQHQARLFHVEHGEITPISG